MFSNKVIGITIVSGVGMAVLGNWLYRDRKRRSHSEIQKSSAEGICFSISACISHNRINQLLPNLIKELKKQEKYQQDLSKVLAFLIIAFECLVQALSNQLMKTILFKYPDLEDEYAVQKFFIAEIGLGEQLLFAGDIENGVEHLANAVSVIPHKENLLDSIRTQLPDPFFRMLIQALPETIKVRSSVFTCYI